MQILKRFEDSKLIMKLAKYKLDTKFRRTTRKFNIMLEALILNNTHYGDNFYQNMKTSINY